MGLISDNPFKNYYEDVLLRMCSRFKICLCQNSVTEFGFCISLWVLSLNVNLRLRTKDLQCRRVRDFYLAQNIGKKAFLKVLLYTMQSLVSIFKNLTCWSFQCLMLGLTTGAKETYDVQSQS